MADIYWPCVLGFGSKDIGSGAFYSRVASSKEIRHNMSHNLVRVSLRSLLVLWHFTTEEGRKSNN